jgi:hypothetical protein
VTATEPRPVPTTGYSLWLCIPGPVRTALRARVPLDCRDHGGGAESLVVAVGSGCPLTWLQVQPAASGELSVRLWEVRQRVKELAAETTTADRLPALLQELAARFGLGG